MRPDKPAFSALTPYLIPQKLQGVKVVNLGDGFILRAIERLLGRFEPARIWTSRSAPDASAKQVMAESGAVILAGANQLNDRFSVWPGATEQDIRERDWRFVPMGVGLHGVPSLNERLTEGARAQLLAIHERTEFSSWRCPRTVAYLERWIPELRGRLLMTGCPVALDAPLLEGSRFETGESRIAVTVTERDNFWRRESATLDFVARRYPRSKRWLVLHQNYEPVGRFERLRHMAGLGRATDSPIVALRRYARKLGFEIHAPANADDALAFYKGIDLHFGSRLHAHLHMISQNKRSFLTYVDERATGMSEALSFPLCDPERFADYEDVDFEAVRSGARRAHAEMTRFVRSIVP